MGAISAILLLASTAGAFGPIRTLTAKPTTAQNYVDNPPWPWHVDEQQDTSFINNSYYEDELVLAPPARVITSGRDRRAGRMSLDMCHPTTTSSFVDRDDGRATVRVRTKASGDRRRRDHTWETLAEVTLTRTKAPGNRGRDVGEGLVPAPPARATTRGCDRRARRMSLDMCSATTSSFASGDDRRRRFGEGRGVPAPRGVISGRERRRRRNARESFSPIRDASVVGLLGAAGEAATPPPRATPVEVAERLGKISTDATDAGRRSFRDGVGGGSSVGGGASAPASAVARDRDASSAPIDIDTQARMSLPEHLQLRSSPGKGLGVICRKAISKGEFVGDYRGEVMMEDVKDRRYLPSLQGEQTQEDKDWVQSRLDRGQTLTGDYLYGIQLPSTGAAGWAQNANGRIYLDAEDESCSLWTRFLNHASPPHANVNPKSIHESFDGNPRVWFVANRDIEAGEELCFDYGDDYWLDGDNVV